MISYAQNFEDVMLWRALKNIKKGLYIDVGANDPVIDSVTKWFYDQGWNGINIEPDERYYKALENDRPRDININVALGEKEGEIEFYETNTRGWSTSNASIGGQYTRDNELYNKRSIKCRMLKNICDEYVKDKDINFLKIDVEGSEFEVLKGMDFAKHRPWILVIEATKPNTMELNIEWAEYVEDHDYKLVWFDGLNRFYVANEKSNLCKCFFAPPTPFDEYVLYEIVKRDSEIVNKQQEIVDLNSKCEAINAENELMKEELQTIKNSISWKMTKPFRWLKK